MKEHFSNIAKASHTDAGKFYWTRNNTVALLVGVDCNCPEFRIVNFTSAIVRLEGEPLDDFNTVMFDENTGVCFGGHYPVCGVANGCAYGQDFDIVAELTEEEIEYFVPRGE